MDCILYMRRIGLDDLAELVETGAFEPTLENLNCIVYAHQLAISFENMTPFLEQRVPSLEVDDLFAKIVQGKRGGYCFEINCLFQHFLSDLGYDAWPVFVRLNAQRDQLTPVSHRGTLVRVNGALHFCDVGLGGAMPSFAVELSDRRQTLHGETYWVEKSALGYQQLLRYRGNYLGDGEGEAADEGVLRQEKVEAVFDVLPVVDADFNAINMRYASAGGFFTLSAMTNRRLPDGYAAISNGKLKVRHGNETTVRDLADDELGVVLRDVFDIEL